MRMRRSVTAVAAGSAALLLVVAPAASAAPPERDTFAAECDDGGSYEVTVHGNGTWTPARIVGSTDVFIPVTFSDLTFTAVLPDGTEIVESEPGVDAKGDVAMRNPRPLLTCQVSASFVLDEAEDGLPAGTELHFSGTVSGHLVGRR